MFDAATPIHPVTAPGLEPGVDLGLAGQLLADAYHQLIHTLRLALPPPLTDAPEDLRRRDHAAIARIAALCPANAVEADLAAQSVAASEQWKDCLRLAQLPGTTPERAAKCRAQALGMMRQANGALRLLLSLQAGRRKIEADSVACDRAAWTEHCAIGLMVEALSHHPHPSPLPEGEGESATFPLPLGEGQGEGEAPSAAIPEAAAPPPAPEPEPDPEPVDQPGPELLAAAEAYAAENPIRAALIRRFGRMQDAQHRLAGVPLRDSFFFTPPDDDLMQALIAARSPCLVALDRAFLRSHAAPGARAG